MNPARARRCDRGQPSNHATGVLEKIQTPGRLDARVIRESEDRPSSGFVFFGGEKAKRGDVVRSDAEKPGEPTPDPRPMIALRGRVSSAATKIVPLLPSIFERGAVFGSCGV